MTDPKIFEPQEDNFDFDDVEPQVHKRLLNTKEKKPLKTN